MTQPTLFDPATGDVALAVIAPDVWVIDDDTLNTVVETWRKNLRENY